MRALVFTPLHGPWTAGKHGTFTEETTLDRAPADLVKLATHAHMAGVIKLKLGFDPKQATQSQEDGEKAYAAAQADGSWQHGHLLQHELDEANKVVAGLEQLLADAEPAAEKALEAELAAAVAAAQSVSVDVWKRARKGPA